MSYHCDNPVLHQVLGLKCPCFQKHKQHGFNLQEAPVNKDDGVLQQSRFEGTRDPYQKQMMKTGVVRHQKLKMEQHAPEHMHFVPDWDGWSRFVWKSSNFAGGTVGKHKLSVTYSDNISGYQINDTFGKRQPKIVTDRQALCVNLPNQLKPGLTSLHNGSHIVLEFEQPVSGVQFAIMSPTIGVNRKDAIRVFCNDKPIEDGEYYHGDGILFSGNTFLAMKLTPDEVGHSDILVKFTDKKIKRVKIEFSNLDKDAVGGRLALTDILVK